ncbi:MAG: AAA family ATPase [Planctomycetes bacterium]|nr:AAA family ATPase [Planctomycetota bacterium]
MYESFFHLRERPFAASPRIDRYYPGQAAEAVRLAAARCIERAEGYVVILGASGTGKTLLCQVLAEQFRNTLTPVLLSGGALTSRKALLQGLLFELGLPFKRRDEGEMRLALLDRIAPGRDPSEGLLLIVDEAQTLPARLFEELRLLSNVVRQGKSRVRLVFAGAPSLEERLAHPKLTAFQQRISVRSTLHPFSAAETQEYVRAQTAVVGGDPDAIWGDDALATIHHTTDGVPRLINQVCDYALLLAAAGGVTQLHAQGVEEAWADLQQLPFPSGQASSQRHDRGAVGGKSEMVIEFGSLDEELDDTASPVPLNPAGSQKDYVPTGVSQSEVELDFGDMQASYESFPSESAGHHESEEAGETVLDSSNVELDAVYDDYPIIPRVKHPTESFEADEASTAPMGIAGPDCDDVDDWVPVPIMQGPSLATPRGSYVEDPVLPDPPSTPQVVPMRGFAAGPFNTAPIVEAEKDAGMRESFASLGSRDRDDVVQEEVVPSPSYYPGESSGWAVTATAVAPVQKQPATAKPRQRAKRERVFGQLFTRMRKQ